MKRIEFYQQGQKICSVNIPNEFPNKINLDEKPIEQRWGFLMLLQMISADIEWEANYKKEMEEKYNGEKKQ